MASKLFLILMWLSAACFADAEYFPESSCPSNYHFIAGQCFRFYQHTVTWSLAQTKCEEEEATLASVSTDEKYNGLLSHIEANYGGQYWISGGLVGGKWLWTNEGCTIKQKWFGRTPATVGDKCAYICSFTKKYWDSYCDVNKKFICEKKEECITHYPEGEDEF